VEIPSRNELAPALLALPPCIPRRLRVETSPKLHGLVFPRRGSVSREGAGSGRGYQRLRIPLPRHRAGSASTARCPWHFLALCGSLSGAGPALAGARPLSERHATISAGRLRSYPELPVTFPASRVTLLGVGAGS
jgi:hypothetical protein